MNVNNRKRVRKITAWLEQVEFVCGARIFVLIFHIQLFELGWTVELGVHLKPKTLESLGVKKRLVI
jgi:hypothetical protein